MENTLPGPRKHNSEGIPTASRCLADGTLIELVYDAEARRTALAVWRGSGWAIETEAEGEGGRRLVPFSANNNLIKNEVVLLPSEPAEYGNEAQLVAEIQRFIHRYVDVRPVFEQIAAHYVLLTWLYDAFNEVPYLRLRGDFGSGKTRALLTIGSLCYKAFFASGASTVSPIFHILDAFSGTLIFDEADFRFSDEKSEIVKVLNNGNVRGMPVLRTMMNRQREFNPQAFHVFGPKIVATRSEYDDKGLESRFVTEEMGGRKLRADVPINLPPTFKDEARALRNKLLLYRFHRRASVTLNEKLVDPALEPRVNQILLPLLSVVGDATVRDELREAAVGAQADIVAIRGLSIEAQVLEVVADLMQDKDGNLPVALVAAGMAQRYGAEYDRPMTNRWIGGILHKRLGLRTYKSNGVYVIPAGERNRIEYLCARYGIDPVAHRLNTAGSGDVGTLGTS